jgi:2'-5' RNA ligase
VSESFRCFVAVNIPAQLREDIGAFLAREAATVRGVKWAGAGAMHLTLKFLGDVGGTRIPEVSGALDSALAGETPCTVRLRGAGAFPSPARARIVWIGVGDGGAELVGFAGRVDAALSALGFAPEERPFVPHLTIGRVKASPRDREAIPRLLSSVQERVWGSFLVSAVHLMRSELYPSGPTYSILHETCLPGNPRAAEGAHR